MPLSKLQPGDLITAEFLNDLIAEINRLQQQVEESAKKSKLATWLPIVISLAALSVSLTTFLYDHWREKHSLKTVIARIDYGEQTTVEFVIRNLGNKSEVLKSARLSWGKTDESTVMSGEEVGPTVIKPDEVITQKFTAKTRPFADLKNHDEVDDSDGLHIGVTFEILDFRSSSKGSRIYVEKTVPFTVIYFDDKGHMTAAKPTKENADSFVELYSGRVIE